jgi:hypothetical protein
VPDPIRHLPAEGSRWSRRSVVALGLTTGAVGWVGCTVSDPTIRSEARATPGGSRTPTPTPTPRPADPGTAADAATELVLATSAGALATGRTKLSGRQRSLVALVRQAHLERAAALASPDPSSRPTGAATPSPSALPAQPSLRALADAERRVARRYRTAALGSSGLDALLWGSMSVASTRFAAALDAGDPPAAGRLRVHRPMTPVSDSEAVSALVASLHAAVYGYQLALGQLKVLSPAHARAMAGLANRRVLLERLSGQLVSAGVQVPPAAPAYDPSPEVRDAATAGRLIRRIESALLPFCGLWLAAAGRPAARRQAFDTLAATAATAVSWGAPVTAWPGWQD